MQAGPSCTSQLGAALGGPLSSCMDDLRGRELWVYSLGLLAYWAIRPSAHRPAVLRTGVLGGGESGVIVDQPCCLNFLYSVEQSLYKVNFYKFLLISTTNLVQYLVYFMDICLLFQSDTSMAMMVEELVALPTD